MTSPLRERQRADLRARIDAVALRLFAERGFDAVPVELVASEVGISLSTLFRHVRSKDQLLVGTLRLGRAAIVANLAARPPSEPARQALAAAVLQRTEQFADETETLRLWRRAVASAPPRLHRASLLDDDERHRLVGLVAGRLGADPGDLEPAVVVAVVLAAAEQAYLHWLTHPDPPSLHDLTRVALEASGRFIG